MVGYQAPGSPGRLLQDGAKSIRLSGKSVTVRARIQSFSGWSAHDRDILYAAAFHKLLYSRSESLLRNPLPSAAHSQLPGTRAIVPTEGQSWELTKMAFRN